MINWTFNGLWDQSHSRTKIESEAGLVWTSKLKATTPPIPNPITCLGRDKILVCIHHMSPSFEPLQWASLARICTSYATWYICIGGKKLKIYHLRTLPHSYTYIQEDTQKSLLINCFCLWPWKLLDKKDLSYNKSFGQKGVLGTAQEGWMSQLPQLPFIQEEYSICHHNSLKPMGNH